MENSRKKKSFEQFVEKSVMPKESDGTESGFFGTNSLESQKVLGQTLNNQRRIRLSKTSTIIWASAIIIVGIAIAMVFISNN